MGKNIYKYYILKDNNLFVEILKGDFDISDFVELKKRESEDPDFDPNYNSILDIRNVANPFSKEIREDLRQYLEIIKKIQPITKRRKAAVITHTSPQVTGITWYKIIDDRDVDYKVFSTLLRATDWLGISTLDLKHIDFDPPDH